MLYRNTPDNTTVEYTAPDYATPDHAAPDHTTLDRTTASHSDTRIAEPATDAKRRYLCRHIHPKGNRCGSPALRAQHFCYFHDRTRRGIPASGRGNNIFAMPRVDDRAAIQMALYEVLARLSSGEIDSRRGSAILYGLQIASSNLRDTEPAAEEAAAPVEEVVTDYQLGDLAPIAEMPESKTAHAADAPLRPQLVASL